MAKPRGIVATPDAWARIKRAVHHVERNQPVRKARRSHRRRNAAVATCKYAELTASLSAASNFETGATTASAKFLIADPDNPGDLIDGETFTVVNRWIDLSLSSGKHVIVMRVAGEWSIIASECP